MSSVRKEIADSEKRSTDNRTTILYALFIFNTFKKTLYKDLETAITK